MRTSLIVLVFILGCSAVHKPCVQSAPEVSVAKVETMQDPYAAPDPYTTEPGIYPVQVNCDLDAAIKAGKYGIVSDIYSSDIALSACKSEKVEILVWVLDSFNTDPEFRAEMTTPDEILERFDRLGVRPATIWELLALGYTYPILQGQFEIFALGTSLDTKTPDPDMTLFPSIGGGMDDQHPIRTRTLEFAWFDSKHGWRPANVPTAFAVVDEKPKPEEAVAEEPEGYVPTCANVEFPVDNPPPAIDIYLSGSPFSTHLYKGCEFYCMLTETPAYKGDYKYKAYSIDYSNCKLVTPPEKCVWVSFPMDNPPTDYEYVNFVGYPPLYIYYHFGCEFYCAIKDGCEGSAEKCTDYSSCKWATIPVPPSPHE